MAFSQTEVFPDEFKDALGALLRPSGVPVGTPAWGDRSLHVLALWAGCAELWIAAKGNDGRGLEAFVATVLLSGDEWRVVLAWGHDMIHLPLQAVLTITTKTLEVEGNCSGGRVVVSLDLQADTIDVDVNHNVVLHLDVTKVETKPLWGSLTEHCLRHCHALGNRWLW